jgi:hypothetical protein
MQDYYKTKRQGESIDWRLIVPFLLGVLLYQVFFHEIRIRDLEQNNKCVESMQEAIPDPNDDIGRATYLRECME